MDSKMVSVVIPARNEAVNLPGLIQDLRSYSSHPLEILVADSASTDNTMQVAELAKAKVVREEKPGKGRAMLSTLKHTNGDVIAFIDGDASYSPKFINHMIHIVSNGDADIVYGSRFMRDSQSDMSFPRRIGNALFMYAGWLLFRSNRDYLSGFLVARKTSLQQLQLQSTGYQIEAEIFAKANHCGLKTMDVPVRYTKNNTSQLHPLRDGIKIFMTLLRNKGAG